MSEMKRVSLADMDEKQEGTVAVIPRGRGIRRRLQALGIREGTVLTKICGAPVRGPVVARTGSTQFSVGYGIASRIQVEVKN